MLWATSTEAMKVQARRAWCSRGTHAREGEGETGEQREPEHMGGEHERRQ